MNESFRHLGLGKSRCITSLFMLEYIVNNEGGQNMPATIINGKNISKQLMKQYSQAVQVLKEKDIIPKLVVITVGKDPASQVYVGQKEKKAQQVGMDFEWVRLDPDIQPEELKETVEAYNQDSKVSGIIVQLPLPPAFNAEEVASWVQADKDVDGFSPLNLGLLMKKMPVMEPCTPRAIMKLIDYHQIDLLGKNVTIVGRSQIVGLPLALMMTHRSATVSLCHSKTDDLKAKCLQADVLVAAVGVAELIKADMVKEGAVVIDVGINRMPDGKLVGDVEYDPIEEKATFITPVPGGVGPMTVAMLLEQTIIAACRQHGLNPDQVLGDLND